MALVVQNAVDSLNTAGFYILDVILGCMTVDNPARIGNTVGARRAQTFERLRFLLKSRPISLVGESGYHLKGLLFNCPLGLHLPQQTVSVLFLRRAVGRISIMAEGRDAEAHTDAAAFLLAIKGAAVLQTFDEEVATVFSCTRSASATATAPRRVISLPALRKRVSA